MNESSAERVFRLVCGAPTPRGPPASPSGRPAAEPTTPTSSHARNNSFSRTFIAAERLSGRQPQPQPQRPPASPGFAALLGGGHSESDGGVPAYDRSALSPRFARAAEERARSRAAADPVAGVDTGTAGAQQYGWLADAARPGMRRAAPSRTASSWLQECGDDAYGPGLPSPRAPASSVRPKALGLQRPAFVRGAREQGYAGFHGESVGGTVGQLLHGAAEPPPPPLGASPARAAALRWAQSMHGSSWADGSQPPGSAERGGARTRVDAPDANAERERRREVAAVRASEMYGGQTGNGGQLRAQGGSPKGGPPPQLRAAHASPRAGALASPKAAGSARARAQDDGARAVACSPASPGPPGGAASGPFALAAALAHARIPDMRGGSALTGGRVLFLREPDSSRAAFRPSDSFADVGSGLAASPRAQHDPIPKKHKPAARAADEIRNLGLIEPSAPTRSPSRRAGHGSAQRARNQSAEVSRAMAAHAPADGAQGAGAAEPPSARPLSRLGRAGTPLRDERNSVAYALGIDGLSLRQAESPRPRSPARAAAEGPLQPARGLSSFMHTLRVESPRSDYVRSPRAGPRSSVALSPRAALSPHARAWR